MRHTVLTLTIIFAYCSSLWAQEDGSQLLFESFEQRFSALDTLIFSQKDNSSLSSNYHDSTIYFHHWIVGQQYAHNRDSLVDNKVHAEVRAFKHQTGLSLVGQTYYRLDEGLSIDEDDAVSRYNAKIQVELRWNFLGSSLMKRKGRIQELQLKGNMERLDLDKANIATLVAEHQEYYQQKYDSLLASILQHRLINLTLMSQAQMYLLEQGNISSDDMLNIINDKAEAERALLAIAKPYPLANDLSQPTGFIVDIDSVGIINYVREHHPDLQSLQLQSQILGQQMQNESYWTKLNISPFIRYSYYFRTDLANSPNVDLGFSFNIPLSGETGKKRNAMNAQRMIVDMEYEQATHKLVDNIRMVLVDIERLNRTSEAELKRMQELQKYLQIRSRAYNNRKGGYNIILRTKEYNTYLLCWEKLLSYQYQRDCLLMALQTYLPNRSIFDFCVGTMI